MKLSHIYSLPFSEIASILITSKNESLALFIEFTDFSCYKTDHITQDSFLFDKISTHNTHAPRYSHLTDYESCAHDCTKGNYIRRKSFDKIHETRSALIPTLLPYFSYTGHVITMETGLLKKGTFVAKTAKLSNESTVRSSGFNVNCNKV